MANSRSNIYPVQLQGAERKPPFLSGGIGESFFGFLDLFHYNTPSNICNKK